MNPQDTASVNQGNPQQQVIERLKSAVNVLVTVSNSPTVDQLAAAVGFTLTLNKMGKHATAVYSGDTPSTIEFLKPSATIEKNTDSLRDFIVSLDKSKADKLRYKVEDNVVRIFITPYRTSLSDKDLNFSQGDFNVDAVVALGVGEREQLDQAIVAHGRILHDATVITVSAGEKSSSLGAINWQDAGASSLCEMLVSIGEALQPGLLDNQIATAYLTGIVAQTERFRNSRTTPKLMTMSASLMAAGANQQLIASSLDTAVVVPLEAAAPIEPEKVPAADTPDGALTIEHEEKPAETTQETKAEQPEDGAVKLDIPDISQESGLNLDIPVEADAKPEGFDATKQIDIDEHGNLSPAEVNQEGDETRHHLVESLQPAPQPKSEPSTDAGPHLLTGLNSDDGEDEPNSDPLSADVSNGVQGTDTHRILDHNSDQNPSPTSSAPEPVTPIASSTLPPAPDSLSTLPPVSTLPDLVGPESGDASVLPLPDNIQTLPPFMDDNTLRDIEKTFDSTHIVQDPTSTLNEIEEVEHSPHVVQAQAEVVDSARDAVASAINAAPYDENRPQPLQSLNAAPMEAPITAPDPIYAGLGLDQPSAPSFTPAPAAPDPSLSTPLPTNDPSGQSPPPVPPPLMPLQ